MIDIRTLITVVLTMAFAYLGLGRTLPLDASNGVTLVSGIALFAGYLYMIRTLVRLPFALVITTRRTLYARRQHKLKGFESVQDGYVRGFLDTRRWTVGSLALIDRLTIFLSTLVATVPGVGIAVVTLVGFMGIALLLVLYLMRGTFGWLVADTLDSHVQSSAPFPFIHNRD